MIKQASGQLEKMRVSLSDDGRAEYFFRLDDQALPMNDWLGKEIKLHFTGQIFCVHCGEATNKSFNQGYCFKCFNTLAQCDRCIMSPELCHFSAGTCREPEWGQQFCQTDHLVYLANASGLKVGITRASQLPTRWIDQGAVQARIIYRTASRHLSGLVEAAAKAFVADRTQWQVMLKNQRPDLDLNQAASALQMQLQEQVTELQQRFGIHTLQAVTDTQDTLIHYPVTQYPDKVRALNADKTPAIAGRLQGIKGQYLLLDAGVINIRKYTGYQLDLTVEA